MESLLKIYKILEKEIDPAYRLRAERISEEISFERPKRILDTGCGRGFYVKLFTLFDFVEEIRGIDVNENYLSVARDITKGDKKVFIEKGSIQSIPFEDNYFDLVICSEVLEHLPDDSEALLEIKRVLRPKGILLVTVPNKNFPFLWDPLNWILMKFWNTHVNKDIWWLAGIWADHLRLYTKEEIKDLIGQEFLIEDSEEYLSWCWPFLHFLLYGIGKNMVEYMGFKQFNRFNFEEDKTLSTILAKIVSYPTDLLDPLFRSKKSMNIFIKARKTI